MFKSVFGNSFVQALIFILVGIGILFFAKGDNKEIMSTVGITIISVSLFKFFLSANAFSKVISGIIKEAFLKMEFLKNYTTTKLFEILDIVVSELLERNYKDIKDSVKQEIFNILGEKNGYYKSLKIEYNNTIDKSGIVFNKQVFTINNYSRVKEKYHTKITLEKIIGKDAEEMFNLEYVRINTIELQPLQVNIKNFNKNGIEFVSFEYEFDLQEGESYIEIKSSMYDQEYSNAFFIKKTCANVKVSYKFDDTIIEPLITSKYGEEQQKRSRYGSNNLEADFGDRPFFKNEFLFLQFKRNK